VVIIVRVCIVLKTQALVSLKKYMPPSSSLLQGKHLPFTPFPLRLNIFRLFVILSLTQLYRYTPEIFLFSTATFKYKYRAPLRRMENLHPFSPQVASLYQWWLGKRLFSDKRCNQCNQMAIALPTWCP
jgi:hypothetical protein